MGAHCAYAGLGQPSVGAVSPCVFCVILSPVRARACVFGTLLSAGLSLQLIAIHVFNVSKH